MTPKASSHKHSFFRQSGWLMLATVTGGALTWLVHFLSKAIPEKEYGDFGAFLAVVMVLPTIPVQMVFAQQTAKAMAEGKPGETSRLMRVAFAVIFGIWLVACMLVLLFHKQILSEWKVSNPLALWVTLPLVLFSILLPMFWGVLQGAQNFLWLGWSMLFNSLGRIAGAAVAVLVFGAFAAGMLSGVLFGLLLGLAVGLYQTRGIWTAKPAPFDWTPFLRQVIPLMIAFIGVQILFTADTMFVKAYFSEEQAGFYVSAGTLSRALLWLVLPLAAVMFPRLVHSAAKSEKSNLTGVVLLGTAILAGGGALGLTLVGPWVIRLVYKASYVGVAAGLLPWYGAAMVPLALGNVLLNQLMAKPAGKLGLSLCIALVAGGYIVAVMHYHDSLVYVLKVMGLFNLLFFLVAGLFVWRERSPAAQS